MSETIKINSNSASFFLTKGKIKEDDSYCPYTMSRAEIAKVVNLRIGGITDSTYFTKSAWGEIRRWKTHGQRARGMVRIGCQTFSGRNFSILRKWALGIK